MPVHPRNRSRPVYYDPSLAALQYFDQQQQLQPLTLTGAGGGGAPSGAAGGDLGGTYPNPTVTQARGLRESGGTTFPMGAVADGELLQADGGDIVGVGVSILLASALTLPIFGTGLDGDVTLTGNISLSRDMNYRNLDLAGYTITTVGCYIRVSERITGTGTIRRNGGNALLTGGGVVDGGGGGPLGAGSNGTSGATAGGGGNGGARSALTNNWPIAFAGGTAGKGGTGGISGGGQNGGVVSTPTAPTNLRDSFLLCDTGHGLGSGNVVLFTGGQGGSGGGAAAGGTGGGGGAGGGVVIVAARIWDSTCTIESKGGNGAAGVTGNSGGGGGGAGGVVRLVTSELRSTPTRTVTGGAGGAGLGTGGAGGAGSDGYTDIVLLIA
jgi:hypothetical protein